MNTAEHTVNVIMADVLGQMRHAWDVVGEPVGGALQGRGRPDIMVMANGRAPVIIETEFAPAHTLEQDVAGRIGTTTAEGIRMGGVLGVRLPVYLRSVRGQRLIDAIRTTNELEYAVWNPYKFPSNGWIRGNLSDIAKMVEAASVPTHAVNDCVADMNRAIDRIASIIGEEGSQKTRKNISKLLSQKHDIQTWKMAGLILSNAFVFHSHIAGEHGIQTLHEISSLGGIPTIALTSEWDRILNINYYAIFDTARKIIGFLNDTMAQEIIRILLNTTGLINMRGLSTSADVYGSLIQRLIEDRQTLASFYTLPESATLLSGLVIPSFDSPIYADPTAMLELRVGDFACGTGTLLTSAYRGLAANYEAATGKAMQELHAEMMRDVVVGFDVMPVATHLTVSALAEVYPRQLFKDTLIGCLDFGIKGQNMRLGSLDLIATQRTLDEQGEVVGGTGTTALRNAAIGRQFSHILMNPPFTSNTKSNADRHAMFASFGIGREEQKKMSKKEKLLFSGTCANGNAGEASNFIAIADRMLRRGGTLGMVLPSTIAWGSSWKACRNLISAEYEDVCVVSIAAPTEKGMSFSFDTEMGEVLLIAKKRLMPKNKNSSTTTAKITSATNSKGAIAETIGSTRGRFVSLYSRPKSIFQALELCKEIRMTKTPNKLDNGVHGGTPVMIGGDVSGSIMDCPLDAEWWWHVSARDSALVQFLYKLSKGVFAPPNYTTLYRIPMTIPGPVFGISHRDIADTNKNGKRAPFMRYPIDDTAVHRVLINNKKSEQTTIMTQPDGMAVPKHHASEEHIRRVAKTATRLHVNQLCRYTSQSVLFPYTQEPTLASGAFPSFNLNTKHEKAMAIWGNSSLGIMCFWIHAGKQQLGRGKATKTSMENMPILDVNKLDQRTIKAFNRTFDRYFDNKLQPMNMCYSDPIRNAIDDEIMSALKIDHSLDDIRSRFCREPVVRSGRVDNLLDSI